ncbi:MAG: MBL fold metallo-hydrolase [Cyclobacteriaceae bacterium]
MIKIKSFVFNPFSENTYVLSDETNSCVIIDPGCYEVEEQQKLASYIEEESLKVEYLLNTHCHIDHVLGNWWVKKTYKVPFGIPPLEEALLKAVKSYAGNYGFHQYQELLPDFYLNESDVINFGQSELKIILAPGHSPGHVVFHCPEQGFCIGGDVLFQGSIGRTDLPGGDHETLIKSIHEKMFSLDDKTVIFCGHGPTTTIGEEKVSNPFCALT